MECDHQNHRYKPDNTQTLAKPLLQITYNPDIAAGVVCLHICMLKLYVTICLRLSSKRYRQTTIKIDCLYFICMINCFYSISESCRFRSSEFVWIVDSETYALDTAVDDWCHYYRVIEHKTYPFTDSVFSGISSFLYLTGFQLTFNYWHIRNGNESHCRNTAAYKKRASDCLAVYCVVTEWCRSSLYKLAIEAFWSRP